MCTRVLLFFFIGCVLLSSTNSALQMVDICKDDVRSQTALPSTRGAFKIILSYDESNDGTTQCQHIFNSSNGRTVFTFRLDSCSNLIWYHVYIVLDGEADGVDACEELVQSSFQTPIYSVAYSYKIWVSLDLDERKTTGTISHLPNMTVDYESFKSDEDFNRHICADCYNNENWAIESGVCNSSWHVNCTDLDITSSVPPTTTQCILPVPGKSELTSIFVSGFVVLIFVFVALHCGGGKTPPRPTNILTNGHSTAIQHPALSIGDGYRYGASSAGARGFHAKGGSMNFV
ncbi:hypothetical protein HOLleu_13604 [Holothuria leucospilota]|uniref:Uncharacterized protein n=1 Tax=Holothuria leucospilota TaxID=206669 RepID=A0A9Q1CD86_HOLLE|nr:hypothetical protein HOLleu_13604 [Holothuria leucospilota]